MKFLKSGLSFNIMCLSHTNTFRLVFFIITKKGLLCIGSKKTVCLTCGPSVNVT